MFNIHTKILCFIYSFIYINNAVSGVISLTQNHGECLFSKFEICDNRWTNNTK